MNHEVDIKNKRLRLTRVITHATIVIDINLISAQNLDSFRISFGVDWKATFVIICGARYSVDMHCIMRRYQIKNLKIMHHFCTNVFYLVGIKITFGKLSVLKSRTGYCYARLILLRLLRVYY